MPSGCGLAGVVDPGQYLMCDVGAGPDGHSCGDPASRGQGRSDHHRYCEAVPEGLSRAGAHLGRERQHRNGEQAGKSRNGIVDA